MEISLSHHGLVLMQHPKRRLAKVVKALRGDDFQTHGMAKAEIVKVLQGHSAKELVTAFGSSFFTSNQSLTFVKYRREEKEEKGEAKKTDVINGLAALKKNIENFAEMERTGESPQILKGKPDLIRIFKIDTNKHAFLFANKGDNVFLRKNLKLIETSEPNFDLCVWDNLRGILQIRSAHNIEFYKDYFAKNLKNSPDALPESLIVRPTVFDAFVRTLGGTVRTVKGKDPTRQLGYLEKEFKSREGQDVRQVPSYGNDLQGYEILSHGVDFRFAGESYTVYVGFRKGTVWLRYGDPTEDLLEHLQGVIGGL